MIPNASERGRKVLAPFKVAMSGLVFTFRTQRHMRFHLYVVAVVLLLGMFVNLQMREMLVLLFTISLVVVAEMFNSAIEATVDLVSPTYNPMAKFAKDIAAGAVLVTTLIALVVGALLILGEQRWEMLKIRLASTPPSVPPMLKFVLGLFLVFIFVVVGKGLGKRGQVLQGGLVSGHAAFGFFLATFVPFITESALASSIAVLLAFIIAQSRFEAKFHTVAELSIGAIVGTATALVLFGLLPK